MKNVTRRILDYVTDVGMVCIVTCFFLLITAIILWSVLDIAKSAYSNLIN